MRRSYSPIHPMFAALVAVAPSCALAGVRVIRGEEGTKQGWNLDRGTHSGGF